MEIVTRNVKIPDKLYNDIYLKYDAIIIGIKREFI